MMELDGWAVASVIIKVMVYSGSLVAAGTGLFRALFAAEAKVLRPLVSRTVAIAAILGGLATLIQLGTQAGMLAGAGLAGMVDGEMLALIGQTAAGDAYFVRLGGFLLLLLSLALPGRVAAAAGALGALVVCTSFSLSGHTNEGSPYPLQALLVLHLMGIAFWVGVFVPLGSAASGALPLADTAALADKFGRLAAWVVAILALAGVLVAWALLGTPVALLTSSYGRLLGVKLLLVTALLGLAAINKLQLAPAIGRGDMSSARRLGQSIHAEAGLVLFAIVFVAITIRTLLGDRARSDRNARVVLLDGPGDPADE